MKQFVANTIEEEENATHYKVIQNDLVLFNINEMLGESIENGIKILMDKKENFYTIARFCQFVADIRFEQNLGINMRLSNFHGNFDNVLDQYLKMTTLNWKTEEKDKFTKIAREIEEDTEKELASVVLKPII